MHPTPSIIFFTVSSGAGLGLLMLLIPLQGFGLGEPLALGVRLGAAAAGLALVAAGLLASTLHLANPRNAWKAFNRFRTSWLSREGVFSVLLFPLTLAYFGGLWRAGGAVTPGLLALGGLVVLVALATLISTSMIYASLKPIRQWRHPLVPPVYLLFGLATGGTLLTAIEALAGGPRAATATVTLALLAATAVVKGAYYVSIGRPAGPTINTATGVTRAMRLLDTGHSHGTFLTTEFGQWLRARDSRILRGLVFAVGLLLPALALAMALRGGGPAYTVLASVAVLAGTALERWLFFVEARHVVNLYHGQQRT